MGESEYFLIKNFAGYREILWSGSVEEGAHIMYTNIMREQLKKKKCRKIIIPECDNRELIKQDKDEAVENKLNFKKMMLMEQTRL